MPTSLFTLPPSVLGPPKLNEHEYEAEGGIQIVQLYTTDSYVETKDVLSSQSGVYPSSITAELTS